MSEGFAAPPPPPGPPPARTRPGTVTAANLLLLVVLAASVVYLGASIAALPDITEAFEEAFAGTESEDFAGVAATFTLLSGVAYLLVGITLAVLTGFHNRAKNPARIVTWVIGGLGLCCGGFNLIGTALGDVTSNMGGGGSDAPDSEEVARILDAHLPSWFEPLTLAANVVGVLAVALALLLLALPPSNEFFRKREQPFEPPAPGYPPPGYPPPGYPPPGQPPPPSPPQVG